MTGRSVRLDLEIQCQLVRVADLKLADLAVGAQDSPATFVERELGVDLVPIIFGEPIGVEPALLFVRFCEENDVTRSWGGILGKLQDRLGVNGNRTLVVERPASVDEAVLLNCRERVDA